MTHPQPPAGDPGEPRERRDPDGRPGGTLRPTPSWVPVAWALVGLVGGWLVRPIAVRLGATAPIVTWAQPVALAFVAATLGVCAWVTWRTVHVHHQRLAPHQAVNRLVLARACALVGALVAGAYAGYALSWLGLDAELAGQRVLRSSAAALAGVVICVSGLLLERACRVRSDGSEP